MPQPSLNDGKEQLHKNLDLEIRDMISTLTNRIASFERLQKTADPDQVEDLEVDHGVRIITLAGNNVGATMRGEIDDKNTAISANPGKGVPVGDHQEQEEALRTYVNSNFQAVNNSIMMGGSYTTQDPGVHMDISDFLENKPSSSSNVPADKNGKKNLLGGSNGDQQTDQHDSE